MKQPLNLENYVGAYKKHICPYPVLLVAHAYHVFFKRYLGIALARLYVPVTNGVWQGFLENNSWLESQQIMFELYKKNPNIIDEFTEQFKKASKEYLMFTETLMKKDYKTLSNKHLLEFYKRYNKMYIYSFIYGECPAETLKDILEEKLRERLSEIFKDKAELNNIFSLLVIPEHESFTAKEEKELLRIALVALTKCKNPKKMKEMNELKEMKELLKQHSLKYAWVPVDYNGEPWSFKDFKLRIDEMIKDKVSPEEKLKKIESMDRETRKKQLEIKEKYGLGEETWQWCIAAQKCMILMDMKKEVYSKAHYHVQFLMREIGRRLGFTLQQVNFMAPEELSTALLAKKFNSKKHRKILDDRYKSSVYINDGFKVTFVNKETEQKIRKALFKEPENKNELYGTCGNPGYVKGKARLIHTTKDFPKMKQGEILVTAYTTPEFVVVMRKSSGIVTDYGGVTSHSSIVARELNIPCVVGTKFATKLIKTGDFVEINAGEGIVRIINEL